MQEHDLPPSRGRVQVVDAGLQDYGACWDLQHRLVEARRAGQVPDTLLLVEHPPTYTIGRNGHWSNLLVNDAFLQRVGATRYDVDRGGDITFHGPGQVVGYVIMDLGHAERRVRRFVDRIERTIIDAVAAFGLEAGVDPAHPGVWLGRNKIAAIGVAISRRITYHGFALNVATDLRYFDYMIPCGIPDRGATSIARELGRPVARAGAIPPLLDAFARAFEVEIETGITLDDLLRDITPLGAAGTDRRA